MNTNTKYVESQGKQVVDWNAILRQESYTLEEATQMCDLSGNWVTCACGHQCDIIPRRDSGSPEDDYLEHKGTQFYEKICEIHELVKYQDKENDVDSEEIKDCQQEARDILQQIESYSAYLIYQITKNNNNG